MTGEDPDGVFDARAAATYDADVAAGDGEIAPACALLDALAEGGPVLEFAIGTGRIALPLARRGVPVSGIELSRAMVARLRGKPGGAEIPVTLGDMATVRAGEGFALVFLAFNTICNLLTQDAQVACFRNAAAHLAPGGRFLIEVFVPPLRALPPGETRRVFDLSERHWGVDEIDPATQRGVSRHATRRGGVWEMSATPFRYVWPSELDLMARLAGLTPEARWSGWTRGPFEAESPRHVSTWRKPV